MPVSYPGSFDPEKWIAVHDRKNYGDTDESVYRMIFSGSYIRIELVFPAESGEMEKKIYYLPDPIKEHKITKDVILSEKEWIKYKDYGKSLAIRNKNE